MRRVLLVAWLVVACGSSDDASSQASPPASASMAMTIDCGGTSDEIVMGPAPPSSSSKGSGVVHGENGAMVDCDISYDGIVYFVDAVAETPDEYLSLSGFALDKADLGTAGFSDASGSYGGTCLVSAEEPFDVAAGRVWASVECTQNFYVSGTPTACTGSGFVTLENCDKASSF